MQLDEWQMILYGLSAESRPSVCEICDSDWGQAGSSRSALKDLGVEDSETARAQLEVMYDSKRKIEISLMLPFSTTGGKWIHEDFCIMTLSHGEAVSVTNRK